MKHVPLILVFLSFSICFCHAQYGLNFDTLLTSYEYPQLPRGEMEINMLAGSLKNNRSIAQLAIKKFKGYQRANKKKYYEKRLGKIEFANKMVQNDVDKYIDDLSNYLYKEVKENKDYVQCNNDFKKALFSIRKLYKILLRSDIDSTENALKFYCPKRSTISKVVKHTMTWEKYLEKCSSEQNERSIVLLKKNYWREQLNE